MKTSHQHCSRPSEAIAISILALICMCAEPVAAQSWPQISFGQPIGGFTHPTHLASARDGSGRLFVVEQAGRIRIIKNGALLPTPFLDITARLRPVGGSKGLLSVAFPPGYADKQHFYVNYIVSPVGCSVDCGGSLVIARYHVTANPDIADANSEEIVLNAGPFPDHWGGELAFGPLDGYLYFGLGTASSEDAIGLGQDLSVLPGKIMRIDVETGNPATYTIPPTNPYVATANARPEIWDIGLRNPCSSSFDR
jgi:glucose/arabinose dehydrogenase